MGTHDPKQLGTWFHDHARALVLYARQWLEPEVAEDVVQEVFLRLCTARRMPESVKPWLFRCVRNASISRMRSDRVRVRHEHRRGRREPWLENGTGQGLDALAAQKALEALPVDQRETIVLRIWAEMSWREISDVTGQPLSNAFRRYRSGLDALRRTMRSS